MENLKKIQKVNKIPLWLHFKPKSIGKGRERDKIKIIVTFRPYPMRNLKFQKNCNKIQEIKIYHYGFISSENSLEKAEKEKK